MSGYPADEGAGLALQNALKGRDGNDTACSSGAFAERLAQT
jgi:hypothetical protein